MGTRPAQRAWEALERLPVVSPQSTFRSNESRMSRPSQSRTPASLPPSSSSLWSKARQGSVFGRKACSRPCAMVRRTRCASHLRRGVDGVRTNRSPVCLRTRERPPDFLCLAKGLTGGCLPLAATLTTDRVYDAFLGEYHELKTFFYGHSYCENPLGCAAALASLKIFQEEDTLETLREKISLLRELLDGLGFSPTSAHSPMWLHRRNRNSERFRQALSMAESNGRPGVRRRAQARLLTRPILDHCPHAAFVHDPGQLQRAIDAIRRAIREVCEEPPRSPEAVVSCFWSVSLRKPPKSRGHRPRLQL